MIIKGDFRITIGDDSEHEGLAADICFKDLIVALVTQERSANSFEIEIYPCPDSDRWLFDFDDFMEVVVDAKNELIRKR